MKNGVFAAYHCLKRGNASKSCVLCLSEGEELTKKCAIISLKKKIRKSNNFIDLPL